MLLFILYSNVAMGERDLEIYAESAWYALFFGLRAKTLSTMNIDYSVKF